MRDRLKNRLIRIALQTSLALSILFTLSTILNYCIDPSGNYSHTSTEQISFFAYVNRVVWDFTTFPIKPLFEINGADLTFLFSLLGPMPLFCVWFAILYILSIVASYLLIPRLYISEISVSDLQNIYPNKLLGIRCIISTMAMSAILLGAGLLAAIASI